MPIATQSVKEILNKYSNNNFIIVLATPSFTAFYTSQGFQNVEHGALNVSPVVRRILLEDTYYRSMQDANSISQEGFLSILPVPMYNDIKKE